MFSSGIFWGLFIIAFGLIMLIKHFFNFDLPVFRIMFGIFLILLGLSVLFSHPKSIIHTDDQSVVFGNKGMFYEDGQKEYSAVFSNADLDLTAIDKVVEHKIEINCIFSEMTVYLNKGTKVILKSDAVFGSVNTPEPEISLQASDSIEVIVPTVKIKASAVFGKINFIRK